MKTVRIKTSHLEALPRSVADEARRRAVGVSGDCLVICPRAWCQIQATRPGLGDMVAAGLSSVGITKDRVSAVVGRDCGCAERQEWLNRLGHKLGIGRPLDQPAAKTD